MDDRYDELIKSIRGMSTAAKVSAVGNLIETFDTLGISHTCEACGNSQLIMLLSTKETCCETKKSPLFQILEEKK